MDRSEYDYLQDRFSRKLIKRLPTNKQEQYNEGILTCKSILKEVFESQKSDSTWLDSLLNE